VASPWVAFNMASANYSIPKSFSTYDIAPACSAGKIIRLFIPKLLWMPICHVLSIGFGETGNTTLRRGFSPLLGGVRAYE